jgi:hypothetical protein
MNRGGINNLEAHITLLNCRLQDFNVKKEKQVGVAHK